MPLSEFKLEMKYASSMCEYTRGLALCNYLLGKQEKGEKPVYKQLAKEDQIVDSSAYLVEVSKKVQA